MFYKTGQNSFLLTYVIIYVQNVNTFGRKTSPYGRGKSSTWCMIIYKWWWSQTMNIFQCAHEFPVPCPHQTRSSNTVGIFLPHRVGEIYEKIILNIVAFPQSTIYSCACDQGSYSSIEDVKFKIETTVNIVSKMALLGEENKTLSGRLLSSLQCSLPKRWKLWTVQLPFTLNFCHNYFSTKFFLNFSLRATCISMTYYN